MNKGEPGSEDSRLLHVCVAANVGIVVLGLDAGNAILVPSREIVADPADIGNGTAVARELRTSAEVQDTINF